MSLSDFKFISKLGNVNLSITLSQDKEHTPQFTKSKEKAIQSNMPLKRSNF